MDKTTNQYDLLLLYIFLIINIPIFRKFVIIILRYKNIVIEVFMGFKENIKNRRLELNLTLEEVSKRLGISKPTLQRYESGVISNIPFDKIELLAKVLQTMPSKLMGWCEDLNKDERELLNKYNKLDEMGKHTVNVVLEMELNRLGES
jgi:transcriptional regulator with XRE-family HTH domain